MRLFASSVRRAGHALALGLLLVSPNLLRAQAPMPVGTLAPGVNPDDPVGELILRDTPLDAVLASLEQLTGRIVLRPQALPAPQITLNARSLTRGEAIFAIETVLSLNGIGLVPSEERFLKVVPITSVRTEAPELYVGPLRGQPASGKVVSKLFRLQHIDTATFQQQVGQFLSGFGNIVPFQNSNAVIVTDTVANLQRLEYIVEEVDRQVSIETKFYPINYAKPSELAQQIRTMLDSARTSLQGTSGAARGAVQPGQPPAPGTPPAPGAVEGAAGSSLQSVLTSNTSITPDDRTNQIIVITNPANLPFFDNLIAQLDVSADPLTSIEVIPMNYAKANELAGLLSDFISGRSQSSREGSRRDSGVSRTRTSPFPDRNQDGSRAGNQPDRSPRQQAVENTVNNVAGEESASQFSDLVTINSDERTNSIIVAGTTGDISLLKRVIAQLDVVLAQVRIDVLIAEVTLSDEYQRGIDAFKVHFEDNTNLFILDNLGVGPGLSGDVTGTLSGYSLQNFTYNAALNAARINRNINLLSSPNVVTTHNQPATIIVGEARPIISGYTSSLNTTGLQTQNVNYEDIALTLDVTPIIGPNNVVQLEIEQKVDDLGEFVEIGENRQPTIIRREASSYVSVRSGEMVVLGGLTKNETRRTKQRMFLLGEIPVIGSLFTRHINNEVKQELLLFIRPVVLRTTDEANQNALGSVNELKLSKPNREMLEDVTGVVIPNNLEKEKK